MYFPLSELLNKIRHYYYYTLRSKCNEFGWATIGILTHWISQMSNLFENTFKADQPESIAFAKTLIRFIQIKNSNFKCSFGREHL